MEKNIIFRIMVAENRRLQRNFRLFPQRTPFVLLSRNIVDVSYTDGQTETWNQSHWERGRAGEENRDFWALGLGCFLLGARVLFVNRYSRTATADLCLCVNQVRPILSHRRQSARLGLKAKGTRGRRAREGGGSRAQAPTQAGPPLGFPRYENAGGALPRQLSAVQPCAGRGRRRPRPRPRPAGPESPRPIPLLSAGAERCFGTSGQSAQPQASGTGGPLLARGDSQVLRLGLKSARDNLLTLKSWENYLSSLSLSQFLHL